MNRKRTRAVIGVCLCIALICAILLRTERGFRLDAGLSGPSPTQAPSNTNSEASQSPVPDLSPKEVFLLNMRSSGIAYPKNVTILHKDEDGQVLDNNEKIPIIGGKLLPEVSILDVEISDQLLYGLSPNENDLMFRVPVDVSLDHSKCGELIPFSEHGIGDGYRFVYVRLRYLYSGNGSEYTVLVGNNKLAQYNQDTDTQYLLRPLEVGNLSHIELADGIAVAPEDSADYYEHGNFRLYPGVPRDILYVFTVPDTFITDVIDYTAMTDQDADLSYKEQVKKHSVGVYTETQFSYVLQLGLDGAEKYNFDITSIITQERGKADE